MYVTIKYKYENMMSPELEALINEAVKKITSKLPTPIDIDDNTFIESNLRFDSKDEMDKHIEVMCEFLKKYQECIVTDIEVVDSDPVEYINKLNFELKHLICRKYAASIGLEFKSIKEENKYVRDYDFLAKAYEYMIDNLNNDNPLSDLNSLDNIMEA